MNELYNDIANSVDEILREFGATRFGTRNVSGGDHDPDTETYQDTAESQKVTDVVFGYPERLVNCITMLRGDELGYLSLVGFDAQSNGSFRLGDQIHRDQRRAASARVYERVGRTASEALT